MKRRRRKRTRTNIISTSLSLDIYFYSIPFFLSFHFQEILPSKVHSNNDSSV
jgi:hypothetical protein